jgi:elongation factor G
MRGIDQVRNIGISAHIDSGKTTLSERILYYAGRIHRISEVRGEGDGATMDHMDLERERGITITSAATTVDWEGSEINLIDTPGHVDFTVEVERSLRVLDGAVLVLCSVGGVQAQSITVDRQMRRYNVPRVGFINKMDRTGSDPERVVQQLHDKLDCNAVLMQIPIGKEVDFEGVVDLIRLRAIYFDGEKGEDLREEDIPESLQDAAAAARQHMLEALAMFSDDLMELLLEEGEVPESLIHEVLRGAVWSQQITPVFLGTAFRNKGVQPLLDAIVRYLPSPMDCEYSALTHADRKAGDKFEDDVVGGDSEADDAEKAELAELAEELGEELDEPEAADESGKMIRLTPDPEGEPVAMAFKIAEDPFGALTFMRIYQGRFEKGKSYYNQRSGKKERFSRLVRMHADQREEIDSAGPGDIVAALGVDCASGDTYAERPRYCTLESMFVPEPVIEVAVAPTQTADSDRMSKALHRFRREDPTLRISTDEESGETLLAGMGELHLEVYVERIRREFNVEVEVGQPKVNYREAPTRKHEFNVKHKKQTGGSGQYAHIVGHFDVLPDDAEESFLFEEKIVGGRIPRQYVPAIQKGFRSTLKKGPIAGFPVVNLSVFIKDGSYHDVDSSEMAFQTVARTTMREEFSKTKPILLEPAMKIEVECPSDFQGPVVGDLNKRRGLIASTEVVGPTCRIEAEVPLGEAFGYSTHLRSMTQGQGTFSMEFARYRQMPASIEREVIEEKRKEREAKKK